MARTRDRTEDFREAVRIIASKQGFDKVKMARISESLILRRPQQKSPFTQSALKILESIRTLQNFIVNHKKDYMDRHRTTEQDRDNIEHEVGVFVKACREQIENLKNSIESKERKKQTVTWLGVQGDAANAEDIAHKHGVVLILSEQLHSITSFFDQLRAERFREVIDRTMPRRMQHVESKLNSSETSISNDPKDTEVSRQNHQAETKGIQQQLLDEETKTLQIELTNLIDTVQETERKMLEMSALNHLFSTHVLHQAQQIERLYEQAVEATANVNEGNKELTKAIERNSSSRVFLLLFLVVLPLALLFLDWYQ